MTLYYQDDQVTLHHGDAEDILPTLAAHDREVAAKALREAAQLGHQAFVDWTAGERHRKRSYGCYFVSVADLYARALRIEDGK